MLEKKKKQNIKEWLRDRERLECILKEGVPESREQNGVSHVKQEPVSSSDASNEGFEASR